MKVLMLGTAARGGMISVVESYLNSETLRKYQIKFIPTHIERPGLVKYSYFLLSLMRSIPLLVNPDCKIIHLHFSKHGSILRKSTFIFLAKIFFKKTILHMHGADFFQAYGKYHPLVKRFVFKLFNQADLVIVLSERRKKEYSQFVRPEKIAVIPNFIDLPRERKKETKGEEAKIITLGRLGERKGTDDLIRALKKMGKFPFYAELAGDGDLERYKKLILELQLEGQVKIKGWVAKEAKRKLLEEADIFVLPSYHEDLPVAILEAMAHYLPVVSTNVAGITEVVKDGESGYLVDPGDVDSLADRMIRLVESPDLRRKMGTAGRRIIEERFNRQEIEDKIAWLYEGLAHV